MFTKQWAPAVLIAVAAGMAVVFFVGDLWLPLGVAGGVPYVAVVAVGWWLPRRRHIVFLAFISTVLILAGFWFSPPGGEPWVVAINRILALFAVWMTAALLFSIRREEWARLRFQVPDHWPRGDRRKWAMVAGQENSHYAPWAI
ncbi:MAG: hypothetical protein HN719_14115 [Alphaproteobacteria bacterium]|jgi:hypothetical protein|nr:hypothetical protein [Alphaproteobacteria bacterium]